MVEAMTSASIDMAVTPTTSGLKSKTSWNRDWMETLSSLRSMTFIVSLPLDIKEEAKYNRPTGGELHWLISV